MVFGAKYHHFLTIQKIIKSCVQFKLDVQPVDSRQNRSIVNVGNGPMGRQPTGPTVPCVHVADKI